MFTTFASHTRSASYTGSTSRARGTSSTRSASLTQRAFRTGATMAIAAATSAALLTPAAQAQDQSDAVQFTNPEGNVACQFIKTDRGDGRQVLCIANTEGARKQKEECNPPEALVPAIRYYDGKHFELCWNQGLVGTPQAIPEGQFRTHDGFLITSDDEGGLDVFDTHRMKHVARADQNEISHGVPGSL